MDEQLGITGTHSIQFAFPKPDGTWLTMKGEWAHVDGYTHKVTFPGFEARSGESFGLTATFCIVAGQSNDLHIARVTVANGKVMGFDRMADGVVLTPLG